MILRLHDDWQNILTRAWSIRLIVIAAALSGCEVALPLIQPFLYVPAGLFAALSGVTTAAAFVARLVAQKGLSNG